MEANQEGVFEALQQHISLRHDVLLLIRGQRNKLEHEDKIGEYRSIRETVFFLFFSVYLFIFFYILI